MVCAGEHNTYEWLYLPKTGIPDKGKWSKLTDDQKANGKDLSKKISILRECVKRDITMKQFYKEKAQKMNKAK